MRGREWMRRWVALLLALFGTCGPAAAAAEPEEAVPKVIATMFPVYDIARAIGGERVEVTMLMPIGVECHSFEPTPADILAIGAADLFVYTGPAMEPWAQRLLEGLIEPQFEVLDVSVRVPTTGSAEEGGGPAQIWTDPQRMKIMAQTFYAALSALMPENEAEYRANAQAYLAELDALDADIRAIVERAKQKDVAFGGRYAMHYFLERYGLNAISAYENCTSQTEPGVRQLMDMIEEIKEKGLSVVYYEELADPKVARTIGQETGAELLLMHTCHNVSRQEWDAGETYVSLMRKNLENLKKGLNL